jgi:hypothetical protein
MTENDAEAGSILPRITTIDREAVQGPVAVLPVGVFEQHGPHLPLVTDKLLSPPSPTRSAGITAYISTAGGHLRVFP